MLEVEVPIYFGFSSMRMTDFTGRSRHAGKIMRRSRACGVTERGEVGHGITDCMEQSLSQPQVGDGQGSLKVAVPSQAIIVGQDCFTELRNLNECS